MAKALYLDVNIRYHNPNRNMLPYLLKNVFERLDIFGPGYVSRDVLSKGAKAFIERNGPYDFIVSNEMIIFALEAQYYLEPSKTDFVKSFHLRFSPELLDERIITEMHECFVGDGNHKKIAVLLQLDFYNVKQRSIDILDGIEDLYLVTFGKDLIEKKENLENLKYESFASLANDNWYHYVRRNDERIISLPHFIDDRDCNFTPLETRKYDVNIPGVNYWYRKETIRHLDGRYSMPSKIHMKIYSLLERLKLKPFSYLFANDFYNYIFRRAIASSKVTVTCGSALKWPLNKFFEIPAEGSLLICDPFTHQEDLGFVDGETCVVMKDPAMINETLETVFSDIEKYQETAFRGQQMVLKNHSLAARIGQLSEAVDILRDDRKSFAGAYWKDGEFVVHAR